MLDEMTNGYVLPGFELRYTFRGDSSRIKRVAWSPDGCILASPGKGKTIHLWDIRTGKTLRVLRGHTGAVYSVAWSPNGALLASGSNDHSIRIWKAQSGDNIRTIDAHLDRVTGVAWSPDGQILASSSFDKTVCIWNIQTGKCLGTLVGHSSSVTSVAWSPDGQILASSSGDQTVKLWDAHSGRVLQTLKGHSRSVRCVAWSANGELLASCSNDKTIRLWKVSTTGLLLEMSILEGHTGQVTCVSFSYDNHLLTSKSDDGTVRLWRISTLETVAILDETSVNNASSGLAFHPTTSILATLGEDDKVVRIWNLDFKTLLSNTSIAPSVYYTNAKVVLVGDSGVGKSGLGLVLTEHPFVPTASTHARHVWTLNSSSIDLNDRRKEIHEILLWDLAGQPSYRLIHQLHLNEVTVALVVFDARSETDPFVGVEHWDRALRQAQLVRGDAALPLKKFLVAARVDRGGIGVSRERIQTLVTHLAFDGYLETSAKEGLHIEELKKTILSSINWAKLPRVSSTLLFQDIKAFLGVEKEFGRVLSTVDDLYRLFLSTRDAPIEMEDLFTQFRTCIGRVEATGLIQQFSFGNLVLLQPELFDFYASALVNAVKDEPDGLGSILEESVRMGNFRVPVDERLDDKEQEKLLLIAMVEDLLRRELVLREGPYLVFPSQSTRENTNLPEPEGTSVIFAFEGPVLNIYTTLVVRLSYSGLFTRKDLWRNAVAYTTPIGGTYGIFLNNIGEGLAELLLFFDNSAREELRFHFEGYIKTHLQRRALPNTIQRRRIFTCPECMTPLSDLHVKRRRERGMNWIICGVCDTRVFILDGEERLGVVPPSSVLEIDRSADQRRDHAVAQSMLLGKQETSDFDVFLCHNVKDKSKVKAIGEQLKQQGILPWLDVWELRPGLPWQSSLEQQIEHIKSAAVFVGKDGIAPWQRQELNAFLREFARRGCPVIPVLLEDALEKPLLPVFLKGMTWIDFRLQDPDPMEQLIWGITGERKLL